MDVYEIPPDNLADLLPIPMDCEKHFILPIGIAQDIHCEECCPGACGSEEP